MLLIKVPFLFDITGLMPTTVGSFEYIPSCSHNSHINTLEHAGVEKQVLKTLISSSSFLLLSHTKLKSSKLTSISKSFAIVNPQYSG